MIEGFVALFWKVFVGLSSPQIPPERNAGKLKTRKWSVVNGGECINAAEAPFSSTNT